MDFLEVWRRIGGLEEALVRTSGVDLEVSGVDMGWIWGYFGALWAYESDFGSLRDNFWIAC